MGMRECRNTSLPHPMKGANSPEVRGQNPKPCGPQADSKVVIG